MEQLQASIRIPATLAFVAECKEKKIPIFVSEYGSIIRGHIFVINKRYESDIRHIALELGGYVYRRGEEDKSDGREYILSIQRSNKELRLRLDAWLMQLNIYELSRLHRYANMAAWKALIMYVLKGSA